MLLTTPNTVRIVGPQEIAMPATHVVIGAGPVGRSVVAALISRGVEVAVVTRSGASVPGAVTRRADLLDPRQAAAAVDGASVVFQCAQPPYHRWPQQFSALQSAVVEAAAAQGALLVVTENLYGYGPVHGPISEDLPLVATTRKGTVRAQMWRNLDVAHQAGRLRVVAARGSDLFGPGVEASAVGGRFFRALARGRQADVVGDPDRLHSYTYVVDFGEAMVRLSETPATWGSAWHVPNAPAVSTRTLAEQAAALAGRTARLRRVSRRQLRLLGAVVPALRESVEMLYEFEDDWVVDHTDYAAVLGDHATPLDEALGSTMAPLEATSLPASP
jgi:nucleoside-diphosphate-sugar epimerase